MNLKSMALLERKIHMNKENEWVTYMNMVFVCEKWVMYMGCIPEYEYYYKNNNLIKIHLYKSERTEICVDKIEFISAIHCNFLYCKCDFGL